MFDSYHMPALVLTTLLLPAFGYLYLRFRDTRTLLWFLGFLFAIARMLLVYQLPWWDLSDVTMHPWWPRPARLRFKSALPVSGVAVSAAFSHWQAAYSLRHSVHHSLVAYSILFQGVFHGVAPGEPLFLIFPALGGLAVAVGLFWALARGACPHGWGVSCASWWAGPESGPASRREALAADAGGVRQPLHDALLLIFVSGASRRAWC